MVSLSRDPRDPKSKETRNKILAQANTKDSGKRLFIKVNPYSWLVGHYYGMFAKSRD